MPSFTRRFSSRLHLSNGADFLGTILPVSDYDSNVDKLYSPRQLLRVPRTSIIKAADEVIAPNGDRYLVAEGRTDFVNNTILHKTFRLYKITHDATWERENQIIDLVTSLPTGTNVRALLGTIPVSLEPFKMEDLDQKLRIEQQSYMLFTAQPVQINDFINDMRVYRVIPLMGIWVGECQ